MLWGLGGETRRSGGRKALPHHTAGAHLLGRGLCPHLLAGLLVPPACNFPLALHLPPTATVWLIPQPRTWRHLPRRAATLHSRPPAQLPRPSSRPSSSADLTSYKSIQAPSALLPRKSRPQAVFKHGTAVRRRTVTVPHRPRRHGGPVRWHRGCFR